MNVMIPDTRFPVSSLQFRLSSKQIPIFFQLLRKGILIDVGAGLSIKELLCEKLGIHKDYLERKTQTIFLDGRPVDDIESAVITSGSTLALSAAMPGMVGASLRKSGYYAQLRKQVSYDNEKIAGRDRSTPVVVKCFNTIAGDLGSGLLDNGVWIAGKDLHDFFHQRFEDFQTELEAVILDDKHIDPAILQKVDWRQKKIFLQVRAG